MRDWRGKGPSYVSYSYKWMIEYMLPNNKLLKVYILLIICTSCDLNGIMHLSKGLDFLGACYI